MEELEPRLLFSANLPGVLAQSGLFGGEPDSTPPAIVALIDAPAVGVAIGNQEQKPAEEGFVFNQPRAGGTPQKELVFVDAGAPNYKQLINDLLKAQAEGRSIEVVVLESGRDGVERITEAIEERRDVGAVHIVSHGSDGSLTLGDTKLNAYNIERYRDAIKSWQTSLTEGADLLIYGCDFAGSAQGREMVEVLSALTGADVAASTDKTGIADRGGDWELEYKVGNIETDIALSVDLQQSWEYTLATSTFQEDALSYMGTQDTYLRAASPDSPFGNGIEINVDASEGGLPVQSLTRFDGIFGAGPNQIPFGAIIDSAKLTVWNTGGSSGNISLHRMLVPWDESTETWNTLDGGLDNLPGAEFVVSAESTINNPGASGAFNTFTGLEASLQARSDGTANYGWALFNDSSSGRDFASSEWGTVAQRPELSVTWHLVNDNPIAVNDSYSVNEDTTLQVPTGWWNNNWDLRQQLTIDNTGRGQLDNIPILITLDSSFDYANAKADGTDLRFLDSSGAVLSYEIESWTPGGDSYVWVKLNTLLAGNDPNNFVNVYYGNAAATNVQDSTVVWANGYAGVWHLNGDVLDATGANITTNNGSTNFANENFGDSRDFDGAGDYIATDSTQLRTADSFTISLWFNADQTDFAHHLLWQGASVGGGFGDDVFGTDPEMHISFGNIDAANAQVSNVLSFHLGDTDLFDSTDIISIETGFSDIVGWHHVAVVVENMATAPTATMYLDGTQLGTDTGSLARTGWNTPLQFGKPGANTRYFDGQLDQITISTVARSQDWVVAQYETESQLLIAACVSAERACCAET